MNLTVFKKIIAPVAIILAVAAAVLFILRGDEDAWLCEKGEWVKHGNPSASMPDKECAATGDVIDYNVRVSKPANNETIHSPFEIEGTARGGWYFEASFPIKLLDADDNLIAQTTATAQGDWMTSEFVPFKAVLEFASPQTETGFLVFEKDNPSGLIENAAEVRLPVKFVPNETMAVKVFFNNSNLDPEYSCNKVFPVERIVPKTQATARAALMELFNGATEAEKQNGFFSSINSGVEIQSLTIENGTARADFNGQLEYQVGGSCRVSAIRAQIIETLKQFETVKNVILSINGRTEDILQP